MIQRIAAGSDDCLWRRTPFLARKVMEWENGSAVPASKQRILAVNDEDVVRDIISAMLISAGYECRAVESGFDALAMLAAGEQFDLLLTDMINWPMDGFTLLLRVKEKFPDMPVVVASAVQDEAVAKECLRSGAFEYLFLPFEREQLLAVLNRALKRNGVGKRNGTSDPSNPPDDLKTPAAIL
jgi:DNA-binding NtrC family response regulator